MSFGGGGYDRPPPERRPGDWTCSSCGANVFASKNVCFRCQAPREGGYGGRGGGYGGGEGGYGGGHGGGRHEPRPGDWTCRGCGANVFASKMNCFRCKTPRDDSGAHGRGDRYDRYGGRGGHSERRRNAEEDFGDFSSVFDREDGRDRHRDRDRDRDHDRHRDRDRDRDRNRERDRDRSRDRSHDRQRIHDRSRDGSRDRSRDRHRSRDPQRSLDDPKSLVNERDRNHHRARSRDRGHLAERELRRDDREHGDDTGTERERDAPTYPIDKGPGEPNQGK